MNIQQALLTHGSERGRSGKTLNPIGVLVHYVGNPGSTAMANRNYFENGSGGNKVSAHYIVGLEGEIILSVPENERAAHAGKAYEEKYAEMAKTNNSRYIGIEVCHPDAAGKFSDITYAALVELTADICLRHGFDVYTKVLRHYDVTGKECPRYYVRNQGEWNKLRNAIYSGTLALRCKRDGLPVDMSYWERVMSGEIMADPEYMRTLEERAKGRVKPDDENDILIFENNMPETDTIIWNFLATKGLNPYAAAGLMGNLYVESGLRSNNLQNNFEKTLGMTDAAYTAAVDNGTYANFAKDGAGYGLAQWTFHTRKQALLDFAKAAGTSVGDLTTQLEFLWKELQGYPALMNILKTAGTVREASDAVLLIYERPADQSVPVQEKRAGYAQGYFDKFAPAPAETAPVTSAAIEKAPIQLNGQVFNLPRILTEGRNYVRLDMLCEALEFKLGYDDVRKMAVVNTR